MKTKKLYTIPTVTVVEFKVEEVFQSPAGSRIMLLNGDSNNTDFNSQGHEIWNTTDDNGNARSLFDTW